MKKIPGYLIALLCMTLNAFALDLNKPENIQNALISLEDIEIKLKTEKRCVLTGSEKEILGDVTTSYKNWLDIEPKRNENLKSKLDDKISEFVIDLKSLSTQSGGRENLSEEKVENLFLKKVPLEQFFSPIKVKENEFYIHKTTWPSPKCTPTRLKNIERMLIEGKQPLLKSFPIEYHHLNQKSKDKIFGISKATHKTNHKILHNLKKESEIDRSEFAGLKKKAFKIRAIRNLSHWLKEHLHEIQVKDDTDNLSSVIRKVNFD